MGQAIGDVCAAIVGRRGPELVRLHEELAVASGRTQTEEQLCAVAGGDLRPLEVPAQLDGDTHRLVQIAALVALDGPLVSWVGQLDAADESSSTSTRCSARSSRSLRSSARSAWSPRRGRSSARRGSPTPSTRPEPVAAPDVHPRVVMRLVYRRTEMLLGLLISWAVLALAFVVTTSLLDGMEVTGGFWGYVWVALLFGIVNAFIGTILRILTFPLTLLTLGLFSILVNAFLLQITDAISDHFTIDEFWWTAIWGAIIMAIVLVVLNMILGALAPRRTAMPS